MKPYFSLHDKYTVGSLLLKIEYVKIALKCFLLLAIKLAKDRFPQTTTQKGEIITFLASTFRIRAADMNVELFHEENLF